MFTRFLFLSVTLFAFGCDDDPEDPSRDTSNGGSAATSGSGGTAGSAGAGGTAGLGGTNATGGTGGMEPACHMLELGDAPDVGFTYDLGTAPPAMGGVIADGTYVITSMTVYGIDLGITDPFVRHKTVVSGNTWQMLDGSPSGDSDPARAFTITASISGASLTLTRTCPSGTVAPESATFTETPEGFTFYVVDRGYTVGEVFTRR